LSLCCFLHLLMCLLSIVMCLLSKVVRKLDAAQAVCHTSSGRQLWASQVGAGCYSLCHFVMLRILLRWLLSKVARLLGKLDAAEAVWKAAAGLHRWGSDTIHVCMLLCCYAECYMLVWQASQVEGCYFSPRFCSCFCKQCGCLGA
jgi:hypothetical protein